MMRAMDRAADQLSPQLSLLEATRIVARGGDLDSELAALSQHVRGITGALAAVIYLHDPVGNSLVPAAGSGIAEHELDAAGGVPVIDSMELVARVAAERRPLTEPSVAAIFGALSPSPRGLIGVPLIAADANGAEDLEGVLLAAFAGEAPDPHSAEDPLFALADLCALAIRKARLTNALVERSEWIERLASTDPLTGLANRQTFERMLELEIARAKRQLLELSVVVFDVEDFTGLNAREGRAAGDDVLRRLASLLADEVRLVDTIGRLGNDELGLIAPGGGGAVVASRVRSAAKSIKTRAGSDVPVRAATAIFPRDGQSPAELIAAATAELTADRRPDA
jgi:diguanylate cyclase (GGDEF)-like protein